MTQSAYNLLAAGYAPGPMEIAIFAAIVLIFFGPKRLPQLSRAIGRSITDFKRGLHDVQRDIEASGEDDEDELDDDTAERRRIAARKGEIHEAPEATEREAEKVEAGSASKDANAKQAKTED